jgi:hypothetical protein
MDVVRPGGKVRVRGDVARPRGLKNLEDFVRPVEPVVGPPNRTYPSVPTAVSSAALAAAPVMTSVSFNNSTKVLTATWSLPPGVESRTFSVGATPPPPPPPPPTPRPSGPLPSPKPARCVIPRVVGENARRGSRRDLREELHGWARHANGLGQAKGAGDRAIAAAWNAPCRRRTREPLGQPRQTRSVTRASLGSDGGGLVHARRFSHRAP